MAKIPYSEPTPKTLEQAILNGISCMGRCMSNLELADAIHARIQDFMAQKCMDLDNYDRDLALKQFFFSLFPSTRDMSHHKPLAPESDNKSGHESGDQSE